MTQEEQKALLDSVKNQTIEQTKMFVSKSDLEESYKKVEAEFKEKFAGVEKMQEALDEIKKAAVAQGEAILNLGKQTTNVEPLSIKAQLEANKEVIKRMVDPKTPDYTAKTTVIPSAITNNFNGQVIQGIGQIQTRQLGLIDAFTKASIGANSQRTIRYMDETTRTSAVAARAVGAAAGEGAIAWTGYNLGIESISEMIPVAKEMLEDYDFIESEIQNSLLKYHMLKLESELFSGDGSTPRIYGLDARATAWVDPEVNIDNASIVDLILQIAVGIGYNTMYKPNYVIMNDYDALKLRLTKTKDGAYVFPNWISEINPSLGNMRIIATPLVTANKLYVGDFNFATHYSDATTIEIGWNADNFSKRSVTMLANSNNAMLIKTLNQGAFIKVADVATAIALITA